jgi:uncharacterized protein
LWNRPLVRVGLQSIDMLNHWINRIVDGRTDQVFDLIAAGHPASTTDFDGVPLIRWCAYYGDVSAIRKLVAHGEALETMGENLDLNGAAFHGHWRLCQYLIEAGADPDRCLAETGETPLHAALSRADRPAQRRTVAVLLAAGARPNVRTAKGVSTGCFMRDVRTRGESPLHRAAAFADEATVRALLEAGADREALDANGDSPLSWASLHLRPAAILRLLCFGEHRLNQAAQWSGDHGAGSSGMDEHLQGSPR